MNPNYDRAPVAFEHVPTADAETNFANRVYGWTALALAVSALIIYCSANSSAIIKCSQANLWNWLLLLITQFGVITLLTRSAPKINVNIAISGFLLFTVLNGLAVSVICCNYKTSSIAAAFFAAGGTFGVMSLAGYLTQKDLTGPGSLCFMAVIGIIITSLINFLIHGSAIDWVSDIGMLILVVLAVDYARKIKPAVTVSGKIKCDEFKKFVIISALVPVWISSVSFCSFCAGLAIAVNLRVI